MQRISKFKIKNNTKEEATTKQAFDEDP